MKIDAEGAEPLIVRGSDKVFKDTGKLILLMEFAPSFFSHTIGGGDFLDHLKQIGFSIKVIEHDGNVREKSRDDILALDHCDLFLEKH